MSHKLYRVTLNADERRLLDEIIQKGHYKATRLKRAYILRAADENFGGLAMTDAQIANAYHSTTRTVERLRKRFVEDGFEIALYGKPRQAKLDKKIDGDVEAHVIALSRSEPPEGRARWTFALSCRRGERGFPEVPTLDLDSPGSGQLHLAIMENIFREREGDRGKESVKIDKELARVRERMLRADEVGSIFPEKLIFENGGYRTIRLNEVMCLLGGKQADFEAKIG